MRELLRGRREAAPATLARMRVAFYALAPGGWRDYYNLLHPPYTLWHLSYVALGFALAPAVRYDRLAPSLAAFFLGLGLACHALDELSGRPLGTRIPGRTLKSIAFLAMLGAVALGFLGVVLATPWLLAFIAFGVFIALAYNLEWFNGRFHSDLWFALAWGVFPFLTGYWVSGERLGLAMAPGTAAVFVLSLAQRALSKRVRLLRRHVQHISGTLVYRDGGSETLDRRWALEADEKGLQLLTLTAVLTSVSILLARA